MIREQAVGNGGFEVALTDDTPIDVLEAIREGDTLYVTPIDAPVEEWGSIGPRVGCLFGAPIWTVKPTGESGITLSGEGPGVYLGTGDSAVGPQSTQAGGVAGSAALAVGIALDWPPFLGGYPKPIAFGSAESIVGLIYCQFGAPKTRRDIMELIANWFDRYWVINMRPAGRPTLRFGSPSWLWGEPVDLTRRSAAQLDRQVVRRQAARRTRTLEGRSTRHAVLAPDITVTLPTVPPVTITIPNKANVARSSPYRTPDGEHWQLMTSSIYNGIELPLLPQLVAGAELDRRERAGIEVTIVLDDDWDISGPLHPAQHVNIFDPSHPDLVDYSTTGNHDDGGEYARPRRMMIDQYEWPVTAGHGVYVQRGQDPARRISPWVAPDTSPAKVALGEPVRGTSGLWDLFRAVHELQQVRDNISS